ncbi:FKBP-type peptidyl-prolyl cis-trans isomerase [Spirosoma koreense]
MHKLHLIIVLIALLGGLASCKTDVDPSGTSSATLDANKADIMTYATSKGISGSMTTSGLYYAVSQASSSTVTPAFGQEIEFNYKLYVLNGPSNSTVTSGVTDTLIDTTYASTSVYYPFFSGSLKQGLQEGFLQMHEGDKVTLLIPSALAFGSGSTPTVPANSPVRYDITLKRVRTEDQQINEYIAANKLTVTETTSDALRFIKTVSVDSTIQVPTSDKTLTIRYTGRLLRAAIPFDSLGSTVTYSKTKMPAGFNEGLAKLRVGEKATLIFPSSIGYGTTGAVNSSTGLYVIPPGTPLRYDVELVNAL